MSRTRRAVNTVMRDLVALTKPRITVMVTLSAAAGAALASAGPVSWTALWYAMIGTALASAGASALNMAAEWRVDERMARTAGRPIPAGRISVHAGALFGCALSLMGTAWLWWLSTRSAALVAAATISGYVLVYTPLKRMSTISTVVGAVPGALPTCIGWAATGDLRDIGAWILFGILFVWQLPHFWAIAWMYKEDYAQGGLRMVTVVDPSGESLRAMVVWHSVLLVAVSVFPWLAGIAGPIYLVIALALGAWIVGAGVSFARSLAMPAARRLMRVSLLYLPLLLGALVWSARMEVR